jgi:hypothetical protein
VAAREDFTRLTCPYRRALITCCCRMTACYLRPGGGGYRAHVDPDLDLVPA